MRVAKWRTQTQFVVVVYKIECYIIYSYKQRSFENAAHITTSYAQWSKHIKK